jgi:cell division control protein 6
MNEDGPFGWDESVFRDEQVLEIDYLPEAFLHRDEQMETLKYALRPAIRGSRPLNVMARGPPGTGKTTAVQKLFDELQDIGDVDAIRVNCQVDSTRYAVFSRLFDGLSEYDTPPQGIQFKKLFGQITDHLVEENEVLVVALDDVNYLFYEDEASDTLYSLLRAHEAHSGAKIGVIIVSSDIDLDIIEELDSRVRSVFRPEEVHFSAYGEREIVDILRERVKQGFREDAVGPQVLNRVAEHTADSGGDLRVGIDLLRRAGLNAEMRGLTDISTDDVDEAYVKAKHVHLSRHLRGLSESEKALVRVLAEHDGERAGDIYDIFSERTDLGYTRYSEIINELDRLGLIDAECTDVEGNGRSRELSLSYEPEAVLDRL